MVDASRDGFEAVRLRLEEMIGFFKAAQESRGAAGGRARGGASPKKGQKDIDPLLPRWTARAIW